MNNKLQKYYSEKHTQHEDPEQNPARFNRLLQRRGVLQGQNRLQNKKPSGAKKTPLQPKRIPVRCPANK